MKYRVEIFETSEAFVDHKCTSFDFSHREDAERFEKRFNQVSPTLEWNLFASEVIEVAEIIVKCWIVEDGKSRYVEDIEYFDNISDAQKWTDSYNRNSSELNSPEFIRIAEIIR